MSDASNGGSGFLCGSSSFHPYECDGPGKCPHCDRREQPDHDPATCALCDPEYDGAPNAVWRGLTEREAWQAEGFA